MWSYLVVWGWDLQRSLPGVLLSFGGISTRDFEIFWIWWLPLSWGNSTLLDNQNKSPWTPWQSKPFVRTMLTREPYPVDGSHWEVIWCWTSVCRNTHIKLLANTHRLMSPDSFAGVIPDPRIPQGYGEKAHNWGWFFAPWTYNESIWATSEARLLQEIKGPDNPTSQLLPIIRTQSCSGTGKAG